MYEQSFKNIDEKLHTDSGSATELDYIEQTSWILFLKYLDDFEVEKNKAAQLAGKKLFAEGTQPATWKMVDSVVSKTGVIFASYEPAGELKTGTIPS